MIHTDGGTEIGYPNEDDLVHGLMVKRCDDDGSHGVATWSSLFLRRLYASVPVVQQCILLLSSLAMLNHGLYPIDIAARLRMLLVLDGSLGPSGVVSVDYHRVFLEIGFDRMTLGDDLFDHHCHHCHENVSVYQRVSDLNFAHVFCLVLNLEIHGVIVDLNQAVTVAESL